VTFGSGTKGEKARDSHGETLQKKKKKLEISVKERKHKNGRRGEPDSKHNHCPEGGFGKKWTVKKETAT